MISDNGLIWLIQELRTASQMLFRAIQAAWEAIRTFINHATEAFQAIYTAIQTEYRARGAIYGDDHDGMMRWLCTIGRL